MSEFNLDERAVIRRLLSSTTSLLVLNIVILLVGIAFIFISNDISRAIGTSLVASSLVSFSTLWVRFIKTSEDKLLSNVRNYGLKEIHNQRALVAIYEKLLETSDEVDVTGYSLSGFSSQALKIINRRNKDGSPIKVRVLLVNPDSVVSKKQALNEGHVEDYYKTSCVNFMSTFKDIENVEIKLIEQDLPVMIYRLGNTLFTGHYSVVKKSRSSSTVTYEVKKPGELFDIYLSEFEEMWRRADNKEIV